MMSLVYLGCLYVWQGGTVLNYIRSLLGHPVNDDTTPSGRKGDEAPQKAKGYSDGGYSDNVTKNLSDEEPLAQFSRGTRGGTFAGSYQQVPGDGGEDSIPSMSVNSDGGVTTISRSMTTAKKSTYESSTVQNWFLSREDRQVLKRRTIKSRLSPLGILTSFISDLDLISDWYFLRLVLVHFPPYLQQAGLTFAIIGTIMWALSTTEFALLSKLRVMWRANPVARLEHVGLGWQLLANVFLEDLPQFVITVITKPNSIPGVLNIVMTVFSLMGKVVIGFSSTRAPSLSTQFHMIDADPAVTRHLFQLRDDAKKKAAKAEKLVYLAWIYRCSEGQKKAAAVFEVYQLDPTFVNGDLNYMRDHMLFDHRLCITSCGLTGSIPTKVGPIAHLRVLILHDNRLTGTIPKELGTFSNLTELNLANNELKGEIPEEIGAASLLKILNLSGNALMGPIPPAFGQLDKLETLNLSGNQLSGEIPVELATISTLRKLILSDNELTGPIPPELGDLSQLMTLSVRNNDLSGPIPMELALLEQLEELIVAGNMLTDAESTEEELKTQLHPECKTDFLPQREVEVEEPEEPEEPKEEEYAPYA